MVGAGTYRDYFAIGKSAADEITSAWQALETGAPAKILDLPCGFGRVLRWLRLAWPHAEISAMELQHDAAVFCGETFGARQVLSADPLWSVDAGGPFDLVWSGSLLTHLDAEYWARTVAYFRDQVRPGGLVMFSMHGQRAEEILAHEPSASVQRLEQLMGCQRYGLPQPIAETMLAEVDDRGFAFSHYPSQPDNPYGVSVARTEWVERTVRDVGGLRFARLTEAAWLDHHDIWTFVRE